MKRARFTEEQIIGVLKEHEAGAKTAVWARRPSSLNSTPFGSQELKFEVQVANNRYSHRIVTSAISDQPACCIMASN